MLEYMGRGALSNLLTILHKERPRRILIFTGKRSFIPWKESLDNILSDYDCSYYSNFTCNPKLNEINLALQELALDFDLIIAIGGGSVIDFAKAYKFIGNKLAKLVAIPTTAGSGSEATQFAVVYKDGVKTSLDNRTILPDYAICDSRFLKHSAEYLKACTSMDALSHAIESYWAVKSTLVSKHYAWQSLLLCKRYLMSYVTSDDENAADCMMRAANLAGHAINISRTTAAHALSYDLTTRYGLPHGLAVSMNLESVFNINLGVNEENCNDPRGVAYVRQVMVELRDCLYTDPKFNLHDVLNVVLAKYAPKIAPDLSMHSANLQRLSNNPVKMW